jgi:uncharacterized protein (TIGR00369 family)
MTENERLAQIISGMPYATRLGVTARFEGADLIAQLPYTMDLIGNPRLPALHGGAVGAFLEIAAQIRLRWERDAAKAPATIGVTVEYLRPCRTKATFARAEVKRMGRRIVNIHAEAWQDEQRTPLALLQGRFLMPD